jgi:hypothetical protein
MPNWVTMRIGSSFTRGDLRSVDRELRGGKTIVVVGRASELVSLARKLRNDGDLQAVLDTGFGDEDRVRGAEARLMLKRGAGPMVMAYWPRGGRQRRGTR